MGPLGGQVEHVAGVQHPVVHGPEILEDLERGVLDQAAVFLVAELPAPLSDALQQEDVVVVEVGADAAAVDGVAHHQIVKARLGDEVEAVQERVAVGAEQVEALH